MIIIFFERYLPLIIIALFAMAFIRASVSFVKSSEYGRTGVVPPRDLPIIGDVIRQGKPEPVDQYIRLASLTGSVGVFQKIGLTGLPLTTLALVVFFAAGVMLFSGQTETFNAFLDFTKLTLGAFIGSLCRGRLNDVVRRMKSNGLFRRPHSRTYPHHRRLLPEQQHHLRNLDKLSRHNLRQIMKPPWKRTRFVM
jgi:hypothetical protein